MFDTLTKEDLKRLHKDINNHVDDAVATAAFRVAVGALMAEEINKRKDTPPPVTAEPKSADAPKWKPPFAPLAKESPPAWGEPRA